MTVFKVLTFSLFLCSTQASRRTLPSALLLAMEQARKEGAKLFWYSPGYPDKRLSGNDVEVIGDKIPYFFNPKELIEKVSRHEAHTTKILIVPAKYIYDFHPWAKLETNIKIIPSE